MIEVNLQKAYHNCETLISGCDKIQSNWFINSVYFLRTMPARWRVAKISFLLRCAASELIDFNDFKTWKENQHFDSGSNVPASMSTILDKYLFRFCCEPNPKHLLMAPIFIVRLENKLKMLEDHSLVWTRFYLDALQFDVHVHTHFFMNWLHSLFFSSFWMPIDKSWLSKYAFFSRYHSVVCRGFWTGPSYRCL